MGRIEFSHSSGGLLGSSVVGRQAMVWAALHATVGVLDVVHLFSGDGSNHASAVGICQCPAGISTFVFPQQFLEPVRAKLHHMASSR